MRCCGVTKQGRRCERKEQKWRYPFCGDHFWQPLLFLISIGGGLIYVSDLAESLGLKKPIEYVKTTDAPNKHTEDFRSIFHSNDSTYNILLLPFGADGNCTLESNQYHWQVQRRIDELNESENLGLEVQRQDTIMCDLLKTDIVRAYGKELGADLVIYGNYQERCEWDTTLLSIRYILVDTVTRTSPFSKEGGSKYLVHDNNSLVELSGGKLTGTVEDLMYWSLGMREYDRNRYQQSIRYLERISVSVPKKEHAIIFKILGYNKSRLGNYEEAIEDFDLAIQLDPKYPNAYYSRGIAKHSLGNYEEAIEDFGLAIQLDPKLAPPYNNRGSVKKDLGDYEEAIEDFDLAIQLDPKYATAYYNRGGAKYSLGNYEEAIEDFDLVIQLDPKNADAYNNRGGAKYSLGNYEEATEDFDQAIQLDSKLANAYNNRGGVKSNLGNYEEAIEDYSKAIQLDPKLANAYYNRGMAKANLGNYEEAIEDFDLVIQLDPKNANAIRYRKLAYEDLKEGRNRD